MCLHFKIHNKLTSFPLLKYVNTDKYSSCAAKTEPKPSGWSTQNATAIVLLLCVVLMYECRDPTYVYTYLLTTHFEGERAPPKLARWGLALSVSNLGFLWYDLSHYDTHLPNALNFHFTPQFLGLTMKFLIEHTWISSNANAHRNYYYYSSECWP